MGLGCGKVRLIGRSLAGSRIGGFARAPLRLVPEGLGHVLAGEHHASDAPCGGQVGREVDADQVAIRPVGEEGHRRGAVALQPVLDLVQRIGQLVAIEEREHRTPEAHHAALPGGLPRRRGEERARLLVVEEDAPFLVADQDALAELGHERREPVVLLLQARIRLRYAAEGGGDAGTLVLGSVQVRPNSERLSIDNRPLVRGQDYTVHYELGRVTFARPDTLFAVPRQVTVRYEENPLFTAAPTNIMGVAGEIPFDAGRVFCSESQQSKAA
jgi:hypothetical protein